MKNCKYRNCENQVVEEHKILPESTRASAPIVDNAPVKLIENTAEENKKVEEELPLPCCGRVGV